MTSRRALLRVILALVLVLYPIAEVYAITVSWTAPAANTAYAIGASITYQGNATWPAGEGTPTEMNVNLRYNNATSGPIVDSEGAEWSNWTATSVTWKQPTNRTDPLTAAQYQGHATSYFLEAIPIGATSYYYEPGTNPPEIYSVFRALGSIQ